MGKKATNPWDFNSNISMSVGKRCILIFHAFLALPLTPK